MTNAPDSLEEELLLDTQGAGNSPEHREAPDATTVLGRALMCR
jgi:hypothetical protein